MASQNQVKQNNGETPSIRARRVLVPVANPGTAMGLIRLAWSLCDHEHGRVLPLFVTVMGTDPNEEAYEAIAKLTSQVEEAGIEIELLTITAPSVARGILDAARENGVNLMVLGFQAPVQGKINLGPIVEAVARTTPCDLLVYRNPLRGPIQLEDIERVVLPMDGSENSRVAARLGMVLANVYDAQPAAMYVQTDPDLPSWFGLARIEASLTGLTETRKVQRQVVRANDVVSGILSRCDKADMILLGYSERSSLDRWIFGNVAQRMLAQAPGPVILAKRATRENLSMAQRLRRRWLARFIPTLTPSERMEVIREASELSRANINFIVLMIVSSLIASFGLLQSSTAVIIGAMLVAPLMSPLMSFSVGLIQGRLHLMRDAALTTLIGVLIGLGVAAGMGLLTPLHNITPEMAARGQPGMLDMGVALASGVAGAYAMARKDIPSALAGVAIAAALVPPLCTLGLALAFADWELASGSGLLFLTNIVSISLAGAGVFAWLGLIPRREIDTRRQLAITLIVLGILAIPLGQAFVDSVRTEQRTSAAQAVLESQFEDADVLDIELIEHDLTVTIRSPEWLSAQEVQAAEEAIERELGIDINLEITNWRTVSSPD